MVITNVFDMAGSILKIAFDILQEAFNMGRMDRLCPAMLDALAEASPETARKVVSKLHEIDARTGILMDD